MQIRFLKRAIEGAGVQELRDGNISPLAIPPKEDLVTIADAVLTGDAQRNPKNIINLSSALYGLKRSFKGGIESFL
jgi:hypothetical protein